MFGMLTAPLKTPLTHLDDDLSHEALNVFIMVEISQYIDVYIVSALSI